MTSQTGPIKTTFMVDDAIEQFIRSWIDYFLFLIEHGTGKQPGSTARPRQYVRQQVLTDGIPGEDNSPTIVLVTTSDDGSPRRRGGRAPNGKGPAVYDVRLNLGIGILCYGKDQLSARDNASTYGSAIVALLLKRRSIDGALDGDLHIDEWNGIVLNDLQANDQQRRALVRVAFTLTVRNFVSTMGPLIVSPPAPGVYPDPGDWPTVETVNVIVKKEGE